MAPTKPSASAELEIATALDRVRDEVAVLRNILDEIRSDLQWAVRNGRVVVQVEASEIAPPNSEARPSIELTLFNEGDAVELEIGGEPALGEIIEVDDGRNVAHVSLIPSGQTVSVRQDELQKVEPDSLARLPQDKVPVGQPIGELPEPGNLF